ncbi:MAG: septum site-determining protein MinC [Anaerolineae bacterium]|nr:septum site-determining protein MinC [Anaerolineae bacterium]
MGSAVNIRGTRDGLLIILGSAKIDDLVAELQSLIAGRETFFRGGDVILQFDSKQLNAGHLARILQVLDEYDISVRAMHGQPVAAAAPQNEPLPDIEAPVEPVADEVKPAGSDPNVGILVQRTLRSGQSIHYSGHVVIIGDVNPGAEIVAEGDIVVWGHLRGIVHAGAAGDEERCICALAFSPTQLRIGSRIARPPDQRRARKKFGPERAYISDGQIVVEAC